MNRLKLLIIIPHHNNIAKLRRCVDSIYKNISNEYYFEILIVDDYSDDKSRDLLKKFKEINSTNIVFLDRNMGVSNARNCGLIYAKGNQFSHVTFIDCDDHLIGKINVLDFNDSDLTIYESIDTKDLYDNHDNYHDFIIKLNNNDIQDLSKILVNYSLRPNTIRAISSCWGKVYSLKPIIDNNIYFHEKMNTFEDVHFLLRFILVSNKVNFKKIQLYAHTIDNTYSSETFGGNRSPNTLFSFLVLPSLIKKLYLKYSISETFNKHHFLACYYSISFIRIAINRRSIPELLDLYRFVRKRVNSIFVRRCFNVYNCRIAGGRRILKILIIKRFPLLLTVALVFIANRRYR